MAVKKDPAPEAVVETRETVKVEGVVEKPAPEPNPAPTEPEQAAKPAPAGEEVVSNLGHLRVKTSAEKRTDDLTGVKEVNLLRDAKEAHRDAAKLSVTQTIGTEFETGDLGAETHIVRVRLLFAWNDGQGVPHERGKELDLPRNEAQKLIAEGRAERANPPEVDSIEQMMAEAKLAVLDKAAK